MIASNPRAPFVMTCEHKTLAPPCGKPLIVHVVVNVEFWPYDQLTPRTIVTPPHGRAHVPDLPNFCWSEYGNRAGMPRLLELFGSRKIPVSVSINASVIEVYPRLARAIHEAGWEFIGHGVHQRSLGAETDEAGLIKEALDRIEGFTGTRPRGWMSPGWSESFETLDHLRANGIEYVCQWVIDDIPTELTTKYGPVIALPYALDINDSVIFAIEKHSSDEMRLRIRETVRTFEREIASLHEPRILTIPLHPHLSGVPHRINYLMSVFDELASRDDTIFMQGSQILDWYRSATAAQA